MHNVCSTADEMGCAAVSVDQLVRFNITVNAWANTCTYKLSSDLQLYQLILMGAYLFKMIENEAT